MTGDAPNPRRQRLLRALGMLIFVTGLLLGVALAGMAGWADLEASSFDITMLNRADGRLTTLACPAVITRGETGVIRARLTNTTVRARDFTIRARLSNGYVRSIDEIEETVFLEPGASHSFDWPITTDNAVYGRLILVRVFATRAGDIPPRTGDCGIVILGLPGSGRVVYPILVALSLLSIVGGMGLWLARHWPLPTAKMASAYAMGALAALVIGALVFSLLGVWQAVILLLGLAFLLGVSVLTWALS